MMINYRHLVQQCIIFLKYIKVNKNDKIEKNIT